MLCYIFEIVTSAHKTMCTYSFEADCFQTCVTKDEFLTSGWSYGEEKYREKHKRFAIRK